MEVFERYVKKLDKIYPGGPAAQEPIDEILASKCGR